MQRPHIDIGVVAAFQPLHPVPCVRRNNGLTITNSFGPAVFEFLLDILAGVKSANMRAIHEGSLCRLRAVGGAGNSLLVQERGHLHRLTVGSAQHADPLEFRLCDVCPGALPDPAVSSSVQLLEQLHDQLIIVSGATTRLRRSLTITLTFLPTKVLGESASQGCQTRLTPYPGKKLVRRAVGGSTI